MKKKKAKLAKKKLVKSKRKIPKVDKPELKAIVYLDFIHFRDWCEQERGIDVSGLAYTMEASNDSFKEVWIDTLENSSNSYDIDAAKILKDDFDITESIIFWVCW